ITTPIGTRPPRVADVGARVCRRERPTPERPVDLSTGRFFVPFTTIEPCTITLPHTTIRQRLSPNLRSFRSSWPRTTRAMTTMSVRPRAQLDYLPEPDIFHDVFGHVPLHSDPVFADFLQRFGALAAAAPSEADTTAMARLFWFTVEFGLIRERGTTKIYGSGLISSHGDA